MLKNIVRCLAALLLATSFVAHAAGRDEQEIQRYAFTQASLDKYMAAGEELKKLPRPKDKEDEDEKDDPSIDEIARGFDKTPGVKPILARYGFSSREYAVATLSLFNAGFYLAMEPSMDPKGRKQLYDSYPKQLQGNIELLRKNPKYMKKER